MSVAAKYSLPDFLQERVTNQFRPMEAEELGISLSRTGNILQRNPPRPVGTAHVEFTEELNNG